MIGLQVTVSVDPTELLCRPGLIDRSHSSLATTILDPVAGPPDTVALSLR